MQQWERTVVVNPIAIIVFIAIVIHIIIFLPIIYSLALPSPGKIFPCLCHHRLDHSGLRRTGGPDSLRGPSPPTVQATSGDCTPWGPFPYNAPRLVSTGNLYLTLGFYYSGLYPGCFLRLGLPLSLPVSGALYSGNFLSYS